MQFLSNFINNEFISPKSGKYIDNYCPAVGKVYSLIPDSDESDIQLAVDAANAAFISWSQLKATERSQYLLNIADEIERRCDDFAQAESYDQGKPVSLAKSMDIPRAIQNFRFFATAILHHSDQSTLMDGKAFNYVTRRPVGIAGLISPWNLPLYLLTWKIAPALAVGNTAICKPSELTPLTACMLGEVFQKVNLPKGVCNIVHGYGNKVGTAITSHPKIPLISFTGGTKTAESIIMNSAKYFKKLSLELGGKNPNIIFADANLEKCIQKTIRSSFLNQGEICLCGSRIFVEKSLYDTFLFRFANETKKLVVGDPKSIDTNIGALVSKSHLEKVEHYIELSQQEGGTILFGGFRPKLEKEFDQGYFLSPTIIIDLDPKCRVMQEEIFGPVVTITPFESENEAIQLANDVIYGLSASVWTENIGKAHRVAQALDVGTVWINTWLERDLRVPFGGVKASGIGREGGEHSIDFFTEMKNVCVNYE